LAHTSLHDGAKTVVALDHYPPESPIVQSSFALKSALAVCALTYVRQGDLIIADHNPKMVQTMLGHSSAKITLDIYSHVSLALEKQAAANLNIAVWEGGPDRIAVRLL
jgi:hypothetical protein